MVSFKLENNIPKALFFVNINFQCKRHWLMTFWHSLRVNMFYAFTYIYIKYNLYEHVDTHTVSGSEVHNGMGYPSKNFII